MFTIERLDMKSSKLTFLDKKIIKLLQDKGFIKSEALKLLSCEVYELDHKELSQILEESKHFGKNYQEAEILKHIETKRENYILSLLDQANYVVAGRNINDLLIQ